MPRSCGNKNYAPAVTEERRASRTENRTTAKSVCLLFRRTHAHRSLLTLLNSYVRGSCRWQATLLPHWHRLDQRTSAHAQSASRTRDIHELGGINLDESMSPVTPGESLQHVFESLTIYSSTSGSASERVKANRTDSTLQQTTMDSGHSPASSSGLDLRPSYRWASRIQKRVALMSPSYS